MFCQSSSRRETEFDMETSRFDEEEPMDAEFSFSEETASEENRIAQDVVSLFVALFPSLNSFAQTLPLSLQPATDACDSVISFVQQVETEIATLKQKRRHEKGLQRRQLGRQMGKLQAQLPPQVDHFLFELSSAVSVKSRSDQLRLLHRALLSAFKGGLACRLVEVF